MVLLEPSSPTHRFCTTVNVCTRQPYQLLIQHIASACLASHSPPPPPFRRSAALNRLQLQPHSSSTVRALGLPCFRQDRVLGHHPAEIVVVVGGSGGQAVKNSFGTSSLFPPGPFSPLSKREGELLEGRLRPSATLRHVLALILLHPGGFPPHHCLLDCRSCEGAWERLDSAHRTSHRRG